MSPSRWGLSPGGGPQCCGCLKSQRGIKALDISLEVSGVELTFTKLLPALESQSHTKNKGFLGFGVREE